MRNVDQVCAHPQCDARAFSRWRGWTGPLCAKHYWRADAAFWLNPDAHPLGRIYGDCATADCSNPARLHRDRHRIYGDERVCTDCYQAHRNATKVERNRRYRKAKERAERQKEQARRKRLGLEPLAPLTSPTRAQIREVDELEAEADRAHCEYEERTERMRVAILRAADAGFTELLEFCPAKA